MASTFIARDREVAQLDAALSQPGLVTVAGRGGVGKSRLAVRVAAARRDFVGGRLWVSLTPVAEDALVASTVALEVGVALGTDDATAVLAEHLAPLGRVLLVLDGCEIVVDGVASLASALLANCPLLTLVVTSRVPLSLEGERVITVEPLEAPTGDEPAALLANAQVRILIDRVHDSGGDSAGRRTGSHRTWPRCSANAGACRWRLNSWPRNCRRCRSATCSTISTMCSSTERIGCAASCAVATHCWTTTRPRSIVASPFSTVRSACP